MNDINLDDYLSVGYFLIRKNIRPFWLNEPTGLIAENIISLETEFCDKFTLLWGWNEDYEPAVKFGIDQEKVYELKSWGLDYHHKDIDVWSMFYSTDSARAFIQYFIPESKYDGLMLIGAGLHHSFHDDWLDDDEKLEGVEKRILEKLPIETGGQTLGFDISSYAYGDFDHTWFSHLHYRGVFEEHGIRPGQYGLLQTQKEAVIARDYANLHDGYTYDYWLLVSYPITLD